jgi:hypothetical protein
MSRIGVCARGLAVAACAACLIAVTRAAAPLPAKSVGAKPDAVAPNAVEAAKPKPVEPQSAKPQPKTTNPRPPVLIRPLSAPPVPPDATAVDRALAGPADLDFRDTPNGPRDDEKVRQVIALVRQFIQPQSWLDGSGTIGAGPDSIVIRQTPEVQERIETFIEHFGGSSASLRPKASAIGMSSGLFTVPANPHPAAQSPAAK